VHYFNCKLAPYLEEEIFNQIISETQKPVSLRYVARKFDITVYAVKRIKEYHNSINHS